MPKKKVKSKPKAEPVKAYEISKSMLSKLTLAERPTASSELWKKSQGQCALCGLPLDLKQKNSIVPDHTTPESNGGKTTLANLYLAHRTCNAQRQDLDFGTARRLITFRAQVDQEHSVDFDFVLDEFLDGAKRQLVTFETVEDDEARITFGHREVQAQLARDPATGVRYFFAEVPIEHVFNDAEIQPRAIMTAHVRKLALDFLQRPVHEPSNCRLIGEAGAKTARLLQFDGQHKTTAQILLGRTSVPMKIYVEPKIDMLQSLVIKIQQEIKKQPLTRSETLAKIGDVMQRFLVNYKEKPGRIRTERGLVNSLPPGEKKEVRKLYFDELERIVFFDDENELSDAVNPAGGGAPTTDKVVINRIIDPLIWKHLLDEDLDEGVSRDEERRNILLVLNAITQKMLPKDWKLKGNGLLKRRAENFFYQGSIGWWMNEILVPSLRYVRYRIDEKKPFLLAPLQEDEREKIQSLIETMCGWSIWSTDDPDHLKAMRSNTVKNVSDEFPEFDHERLIKEAAS